tara:strand:- start:2522 stop:4909 length:2388 start_codon:yes stop_codon:yes gene_type:complete
MWSIAQRELSFFFSNPIGYLVMGSYLIINTLLLWFFNTPFNILNSGFGDFSVFFELSPWLFLFLIPALSMRSFSEERATGTFELLLTKPIKAIEIYGGKLLGISAVFAITLLPSLINLIAVNDLLADDSFLDWGSLVGSYLGLISVGIIYLSLSLCSSLLIKNQIAAFIIAVLMCFTQFYLWSFIANLSKINWIYQIITDLGIQTHYLSISRGILTLKTLFYFTGLFLSISYLSVLLIKKNKIQKNVFKVPFLIFLSTLILTNLSDVFNLQLDLTQDQRYSLADSTTRKLKKLNQPLRIDVFLEGKLPGSYLRFRNEVDAVLAQLQNKSNRIIINYKNPFDFGTTEQVIQEMKGYGMSPEIIIENNDGKRNESIIFPWIIINSGERSERISLLQKQLGDTENIKLTRSLQQLEYQIMDGIHKITLTSKPNIAVLTSHQTSENIKITDLLQSLRPYYNLGAFNLKEEGVTSKKSLENLNRFDVLLISNPKEAFTQSEKYILDQYNLNGGSQFWMIEGLNIDIDSLFNTQGKAFAFPRELNLDDYFFNYGIRIKKEVLQDLYSATIVLASGSENNSQYIPYPWPYYPLSKPESSTQIGKDLGHVITQFVSPIDTLSNSLHKNPILKSSKFTKTIGVPTLISLEQVREKIQPSFFDESDKILGLTIEGTSPSLFSNKIKPINLLNSKENGPVKIVVFGDGNLAENQIDKGVPLNLGYDKWTNNFYENKSLVMNSIHYLTGNNDRLTLRKKTWQIAFLDEQKIIKNASLWKISMLLLPLLLSIGIVLINQVIRSKQLFV